jgi:hypothetical protein
VKGEGVKDRINNSTLKVSLILILTNACDQRGLGLAVSLSVSTVRTQYSGIVNGECGSTDTETEADTESETETVEGYLQRLLCCTVTHCKRSTSLPQKYTPPVTWASSTRGASLLKNVTELGGTNRVNTVLYEPYKALKWFISSLT